MTEKDTNISCITDPTRPQAFRELVAKINAVCSEYGLTAIAYCDIYSVKSEIKISPVDWLDTQLSPDLLVFFHIDEEKGKIADILA